MAKITEDWTPSDKTIKILEDECPEVDINYEIKQFKDWFTASGRVYKDWEARFRVWVRKNHRDQQIKDRGRNTERGHQATTSDSVSNRRAFLVRTANQGNRGADERIARFRIKKRD